MSSNYISTQTGPVTASDGAAPGTLASIGSSQVARCTTQFDAVTGTTGATLTNVVGMSVTVDVGTYVFEVQLNGVATANSGIKAGFKYTTAVVGTMECIAEIKAAAALVTQHSTTATDAASLAASTTAALSTKLIGSIVVTTGGTIQLQAAQNAAHADTTSVYAGSFMSFRKVA